MCDHVDNVLSTKSICLCLTVSFWFFFVSLFPSQPFSSSLYSPLPTLFPSWVPLLFLFFPHPNPLFFFSSSNPFFVL